ncbi:MAG: cystatin-like fold lipoprotein [Clostridia bacterium]|nr:cystatin-like fold lipoprotein [Clostridia bacterium]
MVSINFERKAIQVAVTNRGKISVIDYDLLEDSNNDFYFEYGVTFKKIYVKDFIEN